MGSIIAELGKIERAAGQVQRALTLAASALVDARAFAAGRLGEGAAVYDLLTDLDAAIAELRALGLEV